MTSLDTSIVCSSDPHLSSPLPIDLLRRRHKTRKFISLLLLLRPRYYLLVSSPHTPTAKAPRLAISYEQNVIKMLRCSYNVGIDSSVSNDDGGGHVREGGFVVVVFFGSLLVVDVTCQWSFFSWLPISVVGNDSIVGKGS